MLKQNNKIQKIFVFILILTLAVQIVGPVLFYPKPAQATGMPVVDAAKLVWDKIQKILEWAWKRGGAIAFKNMAKRIASEYAYRTAVLLGSGEAGQKPLFHPENYEGLWERVSDDALGEFIETLAVGQEGQCAGHPEIKCRKNSDCPPYYKLGLPPLKKQKPSLLPEESPSLPEQYGQMAGGKCVGAWGFGISVCEPPEIGLRYMITYGLGQEIAPKAPRCSFSEMKKNWGEALEKKNFLSKFSVSLNPEENDLGSFLILHDKMKEEEKIKARAAEEDRKEGGGWKGVRSKIAQYIETPASMIKFQADKLPPDAEQTVGQFTGDILADAIGVFTNTLATKLMQRLGRGLWKASDLLRKDTEDKKGRALASLESLAGSSLGGRKAAEAVFASLNTPNLKQGGESDLLSQFITCPSDRRFAEVNNCVTDQSLLQAIENKETIAEALEKDHLHGNWLVGQDVATGKELDYTSGYSLANIKKLRKARVLSLGWEFAALKIISSGRNYTLKQVVDGFDKTGNPFYKLIDPNWVLKLPPAFCRTKAYGQILEAAESDRRQEACVDEQSCLYDDKDGNCQGGWGYCLREENIWRFAGTGCPAHFASCQTFQPRKGAGISYLKDTLDWNCDPNDAGCRWYSQQPVAGSQQWKADKRIYFNKNVEECQASAEGCSEFIEMVNLYTGEPGSLEFGGAHGLITTVAQVLADTTTAYSDYGITNYLYLNNKRKTCDASEVGCEKYIPVNGDPWIPGAVSKDDRCPAECVGYADYKEMPTPFSAGKDQAALIASTAKVCPASESGCDEFTNLDEVAKGGEGKEYYSYLKHCLKIDKNKNPVDSGTTCATFYTWVGSDTTGYQLKTYYLKSAGNEPAEVDNPMNLGKCTGTEDAINNPECKEFYDNAGNVSYHLYKNTITCSSDCHPYRRTIASETDCRASSGSWNGRSCIYMAIPAEGVVCSASNAGCRTYKGTAGSNIRMVFNNDFEDGTNQGWKGSPSNESTDSGGHSLEVANSTEKDVSGLLTSNRTYALSFWAKGGGNISAQLSGVQASGGALAFGTIYSSWEWSGPYTLGPLYLDTGVIPSGGLLSLRISGTAAFYLDNIILKEITDQFLIKDSWQISETCDQIPGNPPVSAPGYMVGCQEYKDRDNRSHYLKSFSKLCPIGVIGCEALIDTKNSSSPQGQKFNEDDPTIDDVNISPDSVVYLIKDKAAFCLAQDKGCQKFGLPELDAEFGVLSGSPGVFASGWQGVYLKNNPDKYETILCRDSVDRCEEYSVGLSKYYFKNPGQRVCEYQEEKNVGGMGIRKGWFKKGTSEPCYPFDPDQDHYPLKKFDDAGYNKWVGLCPTSQSTCTEFIDPQSKVCEKGDKYKLGKGCWKDADCGTGGKCQLSDNAYYYNLNNEELDKASCHGQVSLKNGCVLFNDTSLKNYQKGEENFIYDSRATYLESKNQGDASVNPLPATPSKCTNTAANNCDANIILKVQRDRVCGQWVDCADSYPVIIQGRQKNICTNLELCKRGSDNRTECLEPDDTERNLVQLNEATYKARDITWAGLDYAGYAIPNQYSLELLRPNKEGQLTYLRKENTFCLNPAPCPSAVCLGNYWYCDIGVDGENSKKTKACRGYAEPDSPFGSSVGYSKIDQPPPIITIKASGFQNANVFIEGQDKRLDDCDYTKTEYRNTDKYYFAKESSGQQSIIVDNQSYTKKREDTFLGWRGYCLETDPSRSINNDPSQKACLTWYPTDLLPGEVNIFESDFSIAEVGVIDPSFGPYYCTEKKEYMYEMTRDHTVKESIDDVDTNCTGMFGCPDNNPCDSESNYGIKCGTYGSVESCDCGNECHWDSHDGCYRPKCTWNCVYRYPGGGWCTEYEKMPNVTKYAKLEEGEAPSWECGECTKVEKVAESFCDEGSNDCSKGRGLIVDLMGNVIGFGEQYFGDCWKLDCKAWKDLGKVDWSFCENQSHGGITYSTICSKIIGIPTGNAEKESGVRRWTYKKCKTQNICPSGSYSYGEACNYLAGLTRKDPKFTVSNVLNPVNFGTRIKINNSCLDAQASDKIWSEDNLKGLFVAYQKYKWESGQFAKDGELKTYWNFSPADGPWIKQAIAPEKYEDPWKEGGEGITISGHKDGIVGPEKGATTFRAVLRFFSYAAADQVPIRHIYIRWGDGENIDSPGSYKNRRENCSVGSVEPDPTVCTNGPFEFTHKYSCKKSRCEYKPSVTITDNWGRRTFVEFAGTIVVEP